MRLYLNAGFGEPIGQTRLAGMADLGFAGVRQDIPSADLAEPLVRDVAQEPRLHPLFLIGSREMAAGAQPMALAKIAQATARAALYPIDGMWPITFEIGNEPDLAYCYRLYPDRMAMAVKWAAWDIWSILPDAAVIVGGISNLFPKALRYLRRVLETGDIPEPCLVGFHRYRTECPPETPLAGYLTRTAEFDALSAVCGDREAWCTETGWHTAPQTVRRWGFWHRHIQWTNQDVAGFLLREATIQRMHGIQAMTIYQEGDGPGPGGIDHFGMRDVKGYWKPEQAAAIRAITGACPRA